MYRCFKLLNYIRSFSIGNGYPKHTGYVAHGNTKDETIYRENQTPENNKSKKSGRKDCRYETRYN